MHPVQPRQGAIAATVVSSGPLPQDACRGQWLWLSHLSKGEAAGVCILEAVLGTGRCHAAHGSACPRRGETAPGHGVHRDWLAWTGLISRVGWPADTGVGSRSLGRTWPSLSPALGSGNPWGRWSDRKCNKRYGHFACSRVQGFTQARGMAPPRCFTTPGYTSCCNPPPSRGPIWADNREAQVGCAL